MCLHLRNQHGSRLKPTVCFQDPVLTKTTCSRGQKQHVTKRWYVMSRCENGLEPIINQGLPEQIEWALPFQRHLWCFNTTQKFWRYDGTRPIILSAFWLRLVRPDTESADRIFQAYCEGSPLVEGQTILGPSQDTRTHTHNKRNVFKKSDLAEFSSDIFFQPAVICSSDTSIRSGTRYSLMDEGAWTPNGIKLAQTHTHHHHRSPPD